MNRFATLVFLVVLAGGAVAQTDTEKMMAMYMEMASPVGGHKTLESLAGDWRATTKFWFDPNPTAPPQTYTGTARNRVILGGRFLQSDIKQTGATPVESLTIYGFDRRTNDYTLVGYDTLGTYYITAAGKGDVAGEGIALNGSYLQPPAGGEQKYTFVWQQKGKDEHLMTLFFVGPDGKNMRVAETSFIRKR